MGKWNVAANDVFLKALELDNQDDRRAFLEEACGDDAELRAEVESLLAARAQVGSFLESPAAKADATIDQPIAEKTGTRIGPYKLLQKIGEGGMGVVYMAEQNVPVNRRVALKIIKPGMDTRQVIARFEAERQALAMMDHPNIARALDAGTTDSGRPYFVMELVKGVAITQYCDEKQLTPRERLKLFVPVCHALQHAHQKGIIHRDIKPSNVLVGEYDDEAVPRIIDFGVAKATEQRLTEKTMFTQLGQIVGTIDYMSPEQAKLNEMDIDTRSDIYSLGVLLYELLTGQTPFDRQRLRAAAFDELLRIIREEEPPKPSTRLSGSDSLPSIAASRHTEPRRLSTLVRGELDWIVMKALEKDRARRYETANGFAHDILRYLNDEAVLACPPSFAYRFRKFARRNKVAIATTSIVAVALLLATGISVWQLVRANQANRETREVLKQKNAQYERAEANFRQALDAVDELLSEVGHKDLASVPRMEPVRRRMLEKAKGFFERFLQQRGSDPEVQFEAGVSHRRLGDISKLLGDTSSADREFQQAVGLLERLHADQPNRTDYRRALAQAQFRQASLWNDLGRPSESLALLEVVLAHQKVLTAVEKVNSEDLHDLSRIENQMGIICENRGESKAAEQRFRKATDVAQRLVDRGPPRPEYYATLIKCHGNLASSLEAQGLGDRGWQEELIVLKTIDKATTHFPDEPDLLKVELSVAFNAAVTLVRRRQLERAEPLFLRAVRAGERLVDDFPDVPDYRHRLCTVQGGLGGILWKVNRLEEADRHLTKAVEHAQQLAADYPDVPGYLSNLGGILHNRALVRHATGDLNQAKSDFQQALQVQQQACELNPRVRNYREFLVNHANCLANISGELEEPQGDIELAHERAVDLARALVEDFGDILVYQSRLGVALRTYAKSVADDDPKRALELLDQAAECHRIVLRKDASSTDELYLLCYCCDELVQVLERLADDRAKAVCDEWIQVAQTLAESSDQQSDWDLVIRSVVKRIEIHGQKRALDCLRLAWAHLELGERATAQELVDQAAALGEGKPAEVEEMQQLQTKVTELLKVSRNSASDKSND